MLLLDERALANLCTYRTCPVQNSGRTRTYLGRAVGRDLGVWSTEGQEARMRGTAAFRRTRALSQSRISIHT